MMGKQMEQKGEMGRSMVYRSIRKILLVVLMMYGPCLSIPREAVLAESMAPMGDVQGAKPEEATANDGVMGTGFVLEGLLGMDTSLSGSYQESSGLTIPYDFGTAPVWGLRVGKMLFPRVLIYLTVQQTDFSKNTHTIIGFGGNYDLPAIFLKKVTPYLNATFGASYNTYTGVNAQAGYDWMLGAGVLYPITTVFGVFLEANLSYETAPTGITTSIGSPPGNVAHVSDTWSVPAMIGVRYAF